MWPHAIIFVRLSLRAMDSILVSTPLWENNVGSETRPVNNVTKSLPFSAFRCHRKARSKSGRRWRCRDEADAAKTELRESLLNESFPSAHSAVFFFSLQTRHNQTFANANTTCQQQQSNAFSFSKIKEEPVDVELGADATLPTAAEGIKTEAKGDEVGTRGKNTYFYIEKNSMAQKYTKCLIKIGIFSLISRSVHIFMLKCETKAR